MRSIEKLTQEEKELKMLINSLRNVLSDVPYRFEYDKTDDDLDDDDDEFFE